MRKEWEKFRGPIITGGFKKSPSGVSKLKKRVVKSSIAKKSKLGAPKSPEALAEEWPEDWTDTGTVD